MSDSSFLKPATIALHAGYRPEAEHGSRAVPIYQTTSYEFDNVDQASALFNVEQGGHIYSRITNPTVAILEQRLAALEGGVAAVCTASGMSALFATFISLCSQRDHIVSASQIYGSTATLLRHTLPRFGIKTSFVDINDTRAMRAAINPQTKLIFCESIGNPGLDIANLPAISQIAQQARIPLVVDATFATPVLTQSFKHGADIVVHSVTKWIGGQGNAMGGVMIDGGRFNWGEDDKFPTLSQPYEPFHGLNFWEEYGPAALAMRVRVETMRDIGPAMSPNSAFLLLNGLETLGLRMQRHVENAHALCQWLQSQSVVSWVNHPDLKNHPNHALAKKLFSPGAGSILTFGLNGGKAAGSAFMDALSLSSNLANVGDSRTLVLHPASTTHSRLDKKSMHAAGIKEDLIRVSVGIEDIEDIQRDFTLGLKQVARLER